MMLLNLYFIFFKIGLFTIGGGLAALPLLLREALHQGWFTESAFYHMVAVSESTPGPIGINMATYVGFSLHGISGAVIATLGMVTPSLIIIILIARFFHHFNQKPPVQSVMGTLRPVVTGLIAVAAFQVLTVSVFDIPAFRQTGSFAELFHVFPILIFLAIGAAYLKWKFHPALYILAGAVAGIFLL